MDRHNIPGASAADVAAAHLKDIEAEEKHDVRFLTYWFDGDADRASCLVDAPSKESVEAVHREAHGLVPNYIISVNQAVVEDFLGRVEDTAASECNFEFANPPEETAFRTIMFTDMVGSTSLTQRLGDAAAMDILRAHNEVIRGALAAHQGREVKHTGDGIMASFLAASASIECSMAIQRAFNVHDESETNGAVNIRIGLAAGEPVMEHEDLFGVAVQLASRICNVAEPRAILVANVTRELCIGKGFSFVNAGDFALRGFEDPVRLYEVPWRQ